MYELLLVAGSSLIGAVAHYLFAGGTATTPAGPTTPATPAGGSVVAPLVHALQGLLAPGSGSVLQQLELQALQMLLAHVQAVKPAAPAAPAAPVAKP